MPCVVHKFSSGAQKAILVLFYLLRSLHFYDVCINSFPNYQSQNGLIMSSANRSLIYERVYLPLCKVADTPYHIQGDDILQTHTTAIIPRKRFPVFVIRSLLFFGASRPTDYLIDSL